MDAEKIKLRRGVATDLEFLRHLNREAMGPHVERTYGAWDEASQRKRFDASTDPTSHDIIEFEDRPIGCQWVRSHPDALELVRIYLLPEAQGLGIGTYLVQRLCDRATAAGVPVRLRVLRANPAQRLYRRLGFSVVAETEFHVQMEYGA